MFAKCTWRWSDNGAKYSVEIQKLQREFDGRFQDFRSWENYMKMFLMPFDIDVESVPKDVQTNLLNCWITSIWKQNFNQKRLWNFTKIVSQKQDLRTCSKIVCLLWSAYLCEQFFSKMKYYKPKYRNRISDAHFHATLRIAAEPNTTNIRPVQQTKQFHKSHCKHVTEQRK